jgi:isoquinoline 1-oxidoreductase beta subunit
MAKLRINGQTVDIDVELMANHPKHLAVLNAVAERVGWNKPAAKGVFRGIAQQMGLGSYVAAAAEISVIDTNKIKVHRIVAATDPGTAVNPAQIERQVAGSFVFGLTGLFYGGCTVKDGRIEQTNFDTSTRCASARCRRWKRS